MKRRSCLATTTASLATPGIARDQARNVVKFVPNS